MDIVKHISNLVENQFPAFYQEEGRDFIYFIKKYYEFLEEENGTITDSRSLFDYGDIDTTKEKFLKYFVNKYMNGIPVSMLGDKRFIEKNILDLYRSKGSIEGIRLLFRLLYNEEIQMYIPQYDMLRPSDGKWIRDFYLEVEENEYNKFYQGKFITGSNSRATALVETVETRIINGRPVHALFLSNIKGTFFEDELILTDTIASTNSSRVIGSVQQLLIINGRADYSIGDRFYATNGQGRYLVAVANNLSKARGVIDFSIINGGTGYSHNAVITISNGSNFTGSGASFVISGLSNTSTYRYDGSIIAPYINVPLSSAAFGGTYSWLSPKDINSIIELSLSNITIGTISSITVTNPGVGYNGDIVVSITDPYTSTSPNSLGNNAIIIGTANFLEGVVSELRVVDSGFGYYNNNEIVTFINDNDPLRTITAKVVTGGVGYSEGYWRGTDSFLNSDKVIQDSYYYQEYSYEIRSSHAFDKYIDVLRRISHPAGNMPFGRAVLTTIDEEPIINIYEDIRQFATVFMTMSGNASVINLIDMSGNANITTTLNPFNANYCIVSINGVTQNVSAYTTSNFIVSLKGTTLGDIYDVRTFDSTVIDIKTVEFAGNGIVNTFALSTPLPVDEQDVLVTINGVVQHTDQYHIFNDNIVVLNTTPVIGDSILLRTFTVKAPNIATQDIIVVDRYVGNGVTNIFNTQLAISEEQYALITINGVIQHTDVYSINSSSSYEIELVTPPAVGDNIEIRTFRQNIKV